MLIRLFSDYHAVVRGLGFPSLSNAAESGRYAILRDGPQTAIYDGFYNIDHPTDTSALPIEIFHPVFSHFTKNISTAKPSGELLVEVQGPMTTSTGIGTTEPLLAEPLRAALINILGKYMGQEVVGGAIPNGAIRKPGQKCSIPLLVMEYKRAIGEGGRDSLTQASYSSFKSWQDESVRVISFQLLRFRGTYTRQFAEIRDRRCCPTFIIPADDPYLVAPSAAFTDKSIVQRLTGLDLVGWIESGALRHSTTRTRRIPR